MMKRLMLLVLLSVGLFISPIIAEDKPSGYLDEAKTYLAYFDSKGPRPAGKPAEKTSADYICTQLESFGYNPLRQPFIKEVVFNKQKIVVSSENIVCVKAGLDQKEIIVGAHYDSVTAGNGCDDNASGVAVLLEMCKAIKNIKTPYTIRFIFFGAEELGEVGAKYYVENMDSAQIANTLAMLNYDSLIAGDKMYVHGSLGAKGIIRDWMIKRATELDIPLIIQRGRNGKYPEGTTGDWGDQAPFDKVGVQYAAFEATNWDLGDLDGYTQTDTKLGKNGEIWHTKYDKMNYIERTFPGRIDEHIKSYFDLLFDFLINFTET